VCVCVCVYVCVCVRASRAFMSLRVSYRLYLHQVCVCVSVLSCLYHPDVAFVSRDVKQSQYVRA